MGQSDAVKAAIAAANLAFARALLASDIAAVTGMFTEDAVFLPPGGGFIHGRAGLTALWTERLQKTFFLEGGITTESLDIRGDLAIESCTIAWTTRVGDGPPARRTGRALVVWHHDADGQWRMLADYPAYDPPK